MTDFESVKHLLTSGQIDEAFERFGQKVFVEVETAPDKFGRQRYWLHWLADNIGKACNERGLRSQLFFADLEKHCANRRKLPDQIVFIDS